MSKLQMDDGEKNGCQKRRDFEGCVKKLFVKQFLDGKHDRKLADIVSTPVATVSKTYRRRVVSLSKTLYSQKVLVNYPGSDGSVPT